MANKTPEQNKKKARKQLLGLNKLFNSTAQNINNQMYNTSDTRGIELDNINRDVDAVIRNEVNNIKSITTDEMSTFLVKLFNDERNNEGYGQIKSLDDIFGNDTSGLFQFFQQRYQNQNLLYEDLNMIVSQLFELEEAIMTTRDSIVTSDDISNTVSRKLQFKNIENTDESYESYIRAIEELERKEKLLTKIKNQIVTNTLKYGEYYTYVCPYSVLFQEQYNKKQLDPSSMTKVSESIDTTFINDLRESIIKTTTHGDVKTKLENNQKTMLDSAKAYTENITIINDTVSIPLIEGTDLSELIDFNKFNKTRSKYMKNPTPTTSDGTVDIGKTKSEKFDTTTGCYIKYIDPRRIIPIKILDTVIGYYYIHGTDFQVNKAPFSTTIRVTVNNGTPYQNTDDVESMFLSKITDKIVKAFDKPFLEKNAKFKDLILNALMYNDLYKKEIKFQFIPAEYIVRHKVNEDEDGNGQSILTRALFYAKLYLALLVFKMVSIITKSNDTRVYYVKNSGIDQNITNKIQEVARSVKGRQINFMDLLNYNSIISKIGAYKEIFIPVGRSGERGIEFDILSGQDVPLNTDLMELLHTNMINGTGVPSVIMNYINEADYAKTLVMANSKFASRVISYQLDLNESITEMYKLLIRHSNINIPDTIIESFQFTFNVPKTLNTMNMTDQIGNTDQLVNAIIKTITGETADQTDDSNKIKDKIYNILFRKYMPGIDWVSADDALSDAKMELEKEKLEADVKKSGDSDSSDSSY